MDSSLLVHSTASKPKIKRICVSSFPELARISSPNPNPLDVMLESLLELSDSSAISFDISIDRILDSRPCVSDKNDVVERALRLGSAFTEAAWRAARRLASIHNVVAWALPLDITIKIFSLLDTQSVCHAATACSFFHKCAADPLCYSNIDLITVSPKVNNIVVSTMIQRAGKGLRSLKLGVVSCPQSQSPGSSEVPIYSTMNFSYKSHFRWNDKRSRQGKESFILTRSCLAPLSADGGTSGSLLRRLHLYNIERMDDAAFGTALSACPSLLDLEIVGLQVEMRQTLESVSKSCPVIERLSFESTKAGSDDSLVLLACNDLVTNCPHVSSLTLRGFKLHDAKVRVLVKGFRKLKYADFSTSYSITGCFLRNLDCSSLEVLLLRECMHLRESDVSRFLSAILAGHYSNLRHLDVSNREGLASDDDWCHRCLTPSFAALDELHDARPNLRIVADFPWDGSFIEEPMSSSDVNSDSDTLSLTSSSSEMSYGSDQSNGNEGGVPRDECLNEMD